MKHAKTKTHFVLPEGGIKIVTNSYYEELASTKEEIEQHIQTSQDTFLTDMIATLRVLTDQKTRELTIKIVSDEGFQPRQITQIYTIKKENYNKR